MNPLIFLRIAAILTVLLLPASHARAAYNNGTTILNNTVIIGPQPAAKCIADIVTICGKVVKVPDTQVGGTINLTAPSPYMHEPFTVQCIINGGLATFQIIDSSKLTCTLQKCVDSSVKVCNAIVPVEGGTTVGDSTTVSIPPTVLGNTQGYNYTFPATCIANETATPTYQADTSRLSCTIFPCQESKVRLCGTEVTIPGGTALGGMIDVPMPKPFVPDLFRAQCIGSAAQPASYQLFDASAVSCVVSPTPAPAPTRRRGYLPPNSSPNIR